jgi:microcystin-dependent protein
MSFTFLGEVRMFGFTFPPVGWALCDGQVMPISQNESLFSLLGVNFGGDGRSTFGLPNLQGCVPVGAGQGPGLESYDVGTAGGEESVTLLLNELPSHSHSLNAFVGRGANVNAPSSGSSLSSSEGGLVYDLAGSSQQSMDPSVIVGAGGSQPHNNLMPGLVLNFCIALNGIYPARS